MANGDLDAVVVVDIHDFPLGYVAVPAGICDWVDTEGRLQMIEIDRRLCIVLDDAQLSLPIHDSDDSFPNVDDTIVAVEDRWHDHVKQNDIQNGDLDRSLYLKKDEGHHGRHDRVWDIQWNDPVDCVQAAVAVEVMKAMGERNWDRQRLVMVVVTAVGIQVATVD